MKTRKPEAGRLSDDTEIRRNGAGKIVHVDRSRVYYKTPVEPYDLLIVRHTATRSLGEDQWNGTIVLETETPIRNEINARKYIEVQLMEKLIPVHGATIPRLTGIGFSWDQRERTIHYTGYDEAGNPVPAERLELFTICVVTVNYTSAVGYWAGEEYQRIRDHILELRSERSDNEEK